MTCAIFMWRTEKKLWCPNINDTRHISTFIFIKPVLNVRRLSIFKTGCTDAYDQQMDLTENIYVSWEMQWFRSPREFAQSHQDQTVQISRLKWTYDSSICTKDTYFNCMLCGSSQHVSQLAHDVNTTLLQRRCNVMMLHRRWANVV